MTSHITSCAVGLIFILFLHARSSLLAWSAMMLLGGSNLKPDLQGRSSGTLIASPDRVKRATSHTNRKTLRA